MDTDHAADPADDQRRDRALFEALDSSIPHLDGPVGPPAAAAVHAGRRVIRRRRVGGAVAAAAVVALVGVGTAVLGGAGTGPVPVAPAGSSGRSAGGSTGDSTGDSGRATAPPVVPGAAFTVRSDAQPLVDATTDVPALTTDGVLVVPPGTRVSALVQDPLGDAVPGDSVALEYTQPGFTGVQRAFLEMRPDLVAGGGAPPAGYEADGSGGVYEPAGVSPHLSFREWVFARVEFGTVTAWPYSGLAGEPFLTLADRALVLPEGGRLVARVDDPLDLPDPATSVAVAWTEAGTERWAVVVQDPTWRPGDRLTAGTELLNGYAVQRQEPVPGLTFEAWADGLTVAGFDADAPPAWAAGPA